jgi:hypothetical protein
MELKQITTGSLQSVYSEHEITVAGNSFYELSNPYNFFRCLEANHNFQVAWSSAIGKTDYSAGLRAKFEEVLPSVLIFNPVATPLTVKIGLGIGDIDDSRLTVSGTVLTQPAQFNTFVAQTLTISGGQAIISPAQKNIIQNTGSNIMYIGGSGTDGLQLLAGTTIDLTVDDTITVFGTDGDTLAVGSFN